MSSKEKIISDAVQLVALGGSGNQMVTTDNLGNLGTQALPAALPNQAGHAGEFLQTNGVSTNWAAAGGGGGWTNNIVLTLKLNTANTFRYIINPILNKYDYINYSSFTSIQNCRAEFADDGSKAGIATCRFNSKIIFLYLLGGAIDDIDLSAHADSLRYIDFSTLCKKVSLDLTTFTNLNFFNCQGDTSMTTFNCSGLLALQEISLDGALNLTALNLTGCTDIKMISVVNTGLTDTTLDAIFTALPDWTVPPPGGILPSMNVSGAVGAFTCNAIIARNKGWTVVGAP